MDPKRIAGLVAACLVALLPAVAAAQLPAGTQVTFA
jgi:hypothetical protein